MSTIVIVIMIVVFVAVVAAVLYIGPGRGGGVGRGGLKRRFGPEYDRVVEHHDGDTKAAERELGERVKRHGSLESRPLPAEARERYMAHWTGLQEQFVESPQKAVAEADQLIAALAHDRGFPDGSQFDEQADALSVHHAGQVDGYRLVHRSAQGDGGNTEELRAAMLKARDLFDELIAERPQDRERRLPQGESKAKAPVLPERRQANGKGSA
ncbi:hypothetical protein [Streptomyces beijiangensis]|uniref:Secreted protein n=1 Tax=Streptomyces beijiangensis TaxID=163361 RepID=A0A939FDZ0_9ACTN|nr:hypothetical protein [Streptomyces beijiangensis]MBO0516584.1 hypothetical protein [Streptomyces beijiangensis]